MKSLSKAVSKRPKAFVLLTVLVFAMIVSAIALWVCYSAVQAECYSRYMGIKNVSAEKIAKIVRGVEMNANNIFDEVSKNYDTPEKVIEALKSKANLNYDVRGYFAAFELDYFPEQGTWFEPYIYQPDVSGYEYKQVGSARHNYTKSPWYVRAKSTGGTFWSDPYYYYDGTSISGHYCTFVRPIYDEQHELVCVCGADMKFEWLAEELRWVDDVSKANSLLNKFHEGTVFDFYTIIFDGDGTCIAHPEGKTPKLTNGKVLNDISRRHGGVADIKIDGVPCTIYYGPVEFVNWTVATIVPKYDIMKPLIPVAAGLLVLDLLGVVLVWLVLRKIRYEKAG